MNIKELKAGKIIKVSEHFTNPTEVIVHRGAIIRMPYKDYPGWIDIVSADGKGFRGTSFTFGNETRFSPKIVINPKDIVPSRLPKKLSDDFKRQAVEEWEYKFQKVAEDVTGMHYELPSGEVLIGNTYTPQSRTIEFLIDFAVPESDKNGYEGVDLTILKQLGTALAKLPLIKVKMLKPSLEEITNHDASRSLEGYDKYVKTITLEVKAGKDSQVPVSAIWDTILGVLK